MNDDAQFECMACHISHDDDGKKAMTSCRLCGRLHCQGCVDEYGRCVECSDKDKVES